VIDEETPPLSELGHFADNIYKLGPLTMKDYAAQLLEFVELAFPKKVAAAMRGDVTRYLEQPSGGVRWDKEKYIWQTDKDERHAESVEVESWNKGQAGNEGWEWDLVTDP
jgi:alpha 1,6-mannosyltransferase